MNFPQFWARGQAGDFLAWRWSFQSLAEAQALANRAAQELAARFRRGDYPSRQGTYYPTRPFREQILQEFKAADGGVCAVITRNSYGCLVLNTARIMFVDIDLVQQEESPGLLERLFRKRSPALSDEGVTEALSRVEKWTRNNPDWGWQVYRTRAGLRLLATHAPVDPGSGVTEKIFEALGADPLYRKLCLTQKCFRARLTPKPWRCGVRAKPERWPWLNAGQERSFQRWQARYEAAAADWATCRRLSNIGSSAVHPEIQTIIELHDRSTRANSGGQLA